MSGDINFDFENELDPQDSSDIISDYQSDDEDYGNAYIETVYSQGKLEQLSEEEVKQAQNYENIVANTRPFDDVFIITGDKDSDTYITDADITITSEISEEELAEQAEKQKKGKKFIIGLFSWFLEQVQEGQEEVKKTSSEKETVREYKNVAVMPKSSFAKPTEEGSFVKKLIFFLIACVAIGVFIGIKANSYYVAHNGKVDSVFSCALMWVMEEGTPMVVDPFCGDVFGAGFLLGAGVLGVIGLFTYLDSDAKKLSRVGHEHGSAHLATPKDFKIYKNRFMEE